jgi:hypothetical protein
MRNGNHQSSLQWRLTQTVMPQRVVIKLPDKVHIGSTDNAVDSGSVITANTRREAEEIQ